MSKYWLNFNIEFTDDRKMESVCFTGAMEEQKENQSCSCK